LIIILNTEIANLYLPTYCSYYKCSSPNVYCKGTAVQLEDGTIRHNKPHTHEPFVEVFNEQEAKNVFRGTLIERSKTETLGLRSIYDEEAIR